MNESPVCQDLLDALQRQPFHRKQCHSINHAPISFPQPNQNCRFRHPGFLGPEFRNERIPIVRISLPQSFLHSNPALFPSDPPNPHQDLSCFIHLSFLRNRRMCFIVLPGRSVATDLSELRRLPFLVNPQPGFVIHLRSPYVGRHAFPATSLVVGQGRT